MTFNDLSSLPAYLASRRSGKPRDLAGPGPSMEQLREMVAIATRTPDHGKLAPWRFIIVPDDKRGELADVITQAYLAEKPDAYSWRQLAGAGALAGIGFTMSLFIAGQAFPAAADFTAAKIAVFVASVVSAVIGVLVLWGAEHAPDNDGAAAQSP